MLSTEKFKVNCKFYYLDYKALLFVLLLADQLYKFLKHESSKRASFYVNESSKYFYLNRNVQSHGDFVFIVKKQLHQK